MTKRETSKERDGSAAYDDQALMLRISKFRDTKAFEALFEKYRQPAYRLALNLTGCKDLAEDAVQEAMVRVWRLAGSFQRDRKLKPWLLRIVATESIKCQQHQKKHRTSQSEAALSDMVSPATNATLGAEERERFSILKAGLGMLEEKERIVVALYYSGGLSQQDIGRALSIPESTISLRLKKTLEKLGNTLRQAGITASVITAADITFLFTDAPLPHALSENVMLRIAGAREPDKLKTGLSAAVLAITIGGICLAASLPFLLSEQIAKSSASAPSPIESPLSKTQSTASTSIPLKPLRKISWNLDTPEAMARLKFNTGWKFQEKNGWRNSGCAAYRQHTTRPKSAVVIPLDGLSLPIKINYRYRPIRLEIDQDFDFTLDWRHNRKSDVVLIDGFFGGYNWKHSTPGWMWCEYIITKTYFDMKKLDPNTGKIQRAAFWFINQEEAKDIVLCNLSSMYVDEINLMEIRTEDLPDVSDFKAALKQNRNFLKPWQALVIPKLKHHAQSTLPISMRLMPADVPAPDSW